MSLLSDFCGYRIENDFNLYYLRSYEQQNDSSHAPYIIENVIFKLKLHSYRLL